MSDDLLPLVTDNLEAVPEPLRQFYAETGDGTFQFKGQGVGDLTGLKNNQRRLSNDLKKAQDALKNYEGLDVEEYKTLKAQQEKLAEEKARAAGEFDKLRTQMADKHMAELKARDERIQQLERGLFKQVAENGLLRELQDVALAPKVMLPHMVSHLRVIPVEGEPDNFTVEVVDPKTKSTRVRDGNGAAMTIGDLVKEFAKDPEFAHVFKGSGASGTGAPSAGHASNGASSGKSLREMNATEKAALAASDPAAFRSLVDAQIRGAATTGLRK